MVTLTVTITVTVLTIITINIMVAVVTIIMSITIMMALTTAGMAVVTKTNDTYYEIGSCDNYSNDYNNNCNDN